MLSFSESIRHFHAKLLNGDKFALGRFGDGEWGAIKGVRFSPGNGEWHTNDGDSALEEAKQKLTDALRYQHPDYYTAICPCYTEAIAFSRQPSSNITYANIFVNANFSYYKEHFIQLYQQREIYLVANKNALLKNLPFQVEKFFPIEYNAWVVNRDLPEQILAGQPKGKLFLFSAGPFSNILAHKLWRENPENVYLDVGSTLDPWTQSQRCNRDYYMGNTVYSNLSCPCDGVHPSIA